MLLLVGGVGFLSQKGYSNTVSPNKLTQKPRRWRNLQLCQHLQQNIDFSNPKTTDWVQPKKSQKKKNVTQIATTNIITSETCQANSTKKKCTTKTATQTTNRSYQDSNLTKSDSYSLCKLKNPLVAFFPCTKYMPNLAYLHLGPKILFCHWFGCALLQGILWWGNFLAPKFPSSPYNVVWNLVEVMAKKN